eukprot:131271-Rhodomonas_salina.1
MSQMPSSGTKRVPGAHSNAHSLSLERTHSAAPDGVEPLGARGGRGVRARRAARGACRTRAVCGVVLRGGAVEAVCAPALARGRVAAARAWGHPQAACDVVGALLGAWAAAGLGRVERLLTGVGRVRGAVAGVLPGGAHAAARLALEGRVVGVLAVRACEAALVLRRAQGVVELRERADVAAAAAVGHREGSVGTARVGEKVAVEPGVGLRAGPRERAVGRARAADVPAVHEPAFVLAVAATAVAAERVAV